MGSFRAIMPEFEFQIFFFFLAYLFALRENLNVLRFTRRPFFLFGACLIHLQTNLFHWRQSKHHTDAVQMQKIHYFCKQEKEIVQTISLNQAKEMTSTKAWVPLSGCWSETRLKNRNLNGLEQKRVRLDDFEVRWACFVSRACILVNEDLDRGRTWASGDWYCVWNRL